MITPKEIAAYAASHPTPFYLYDLRVLRHTLTDLKQAASINPKFKLHYAMKACSEEAILQTICGAGLGLDTVSGGEIELGLKVGFKAEDILFAGVGKTDAEIDLALQAGILAFNVESLPELEAISERARAMNTTARVALRINPDIDAHTHHYITTGLSENKFGISLKQFDRALEMANTLDGLDFYGLHFHIGSQITVIEPFITLCERVNEIVRNLHRKGVRVRSINMGGGLGIDYGETEAPDFATYFKTINENLDTTAVEEVHFEPGRSVVCSCGTLISRVVYVKEGDTRTFVIADAGMTELIRPALYEARHPISNISGELRGDDAVKADVVGPVCESSDVFGKDYLLSSPKKDDILAIGHAGAYGHVMSSHYNCRKLHPPVFID